MKMKLYYVVKENTKLFGHEPDIVYLAGPFGSYQEAKDRTYRDEFLGFTQVTEQTVDVEY